MLGTLIGMATVGGMSQLDPVSFDQGHRFMLGMGSVAGFSSGDVLTYNLKGNYAYDFAGQGYTGSGSGGIGTTKAVDLSKISGKLNGKDIMLSELAPTGKVATAMAAFGPIMSGAFIVGGYKENGFAGAMDAYFLDIATARVIEGERISRVMDKSGAVTVTTRLGMMGSLGVGLGAFAGYELGSQVAGVPGGFVGAALGGKAMARFATNPISTGAMILGGLAAKKMGETAVSSIGHVIKQGYKRGKMRDRIDTAGSTAAFFTQNAVTSRGRAFESMRKSHLNARSALGMEATMTHMNRSYF